MTVTGHRQKYNALVPSMIFNIKPFLYVTMVLKLF